MTSTTTFAPGIQIDSTLQIRTATEAFEISPLRAVLDAEHYLKADRPAGHVLWQGVYEHDPEDGSKNLVAVLCWAGAAKRLKDRDTWIGWDAVTCVNRLKLVVQLRRFLVPQEARRPNLASQCLGLAGFPTQGRKSTASARSYSGEKNDCELPVSQTLLKQAALILANAVITGDAFDTQKKRQ